MKNSKTSIGTQPFSPFAGQLNIITNTVIYPIYSNIPPSALLRILFKTGAPSMTPSTHTTPSWFFGEGEEAADMPYSVDTVGVTVYGTAAWMEDASRVMREERDNVRSV